MAKVAITFAIITAVVAASNYTASAQDFDVLLLRPGSGTFAVLTTDGDFARSVAAFPNRANADVANFDAGE